MTRRTSLATLALLAAAVFAAASCGDNLKSHEDDAAVDGPPAVCGNSAVEAGEDCDDGDTTADMVCDDTCHFTCGNGVVDGTFGELCDTGIASGNGACPA